MQRTRLAALVLALSTFVWGCLPGPGDSNNGGFDAGGDVDCPPGQEFDNFSDECEPASCRENEDCTLGFFCQQTQCVEGPRSCESSQARSSTSSCRGEWLNCETPFGPEDFVFFCTRESDRWECECNRDNIPENRPQSFNDQCAELENIHEQANQLCDWSMPKVDAVN